MTGTVTVTPDVNELTFPTTRKQGRQPRQTETQILRQELAEAQEVATGWHNHLIAAKQEMELLKAEHARQLADKDEDLKDFQLNAENQLRQMTETKDRLTETKDRYYRQEADLRAELEGLHVVLDSMPVGLPRKGSDGYNDGSIKVQTRLSVFLALFGR